MIAKPNDLRSNTNPFASHCIYSGQLLCICTYSIFTMSTGFMLQFYRRSSASLLCRCFVLYCRLSNSIIHRCVQPASAAASHGRSPPTFGPSFNTANHPRQFIFHPCALPSKTRQPMERVRYRSRRGVRLLLSFHPFPQTLLDVQNLSRPRVHSLHFSFHSVQRFLKSEYDYYELSIDGFMDWTPKK